MSCALSFDLALGRARHNRSGTFVFRDSDAPSREWGKEASAHLSTFLAKTKRSQLASDVTRVK